MMNILPIADKDFVYLYTIDTKNVRYIADNFNDRYKVKKEERLDCDFIGGSPYCGKYLETHKNSKILNSQILYLSHCDSKKDYSLMLLENGIKFNEELSELDIKILQAICGGKQIGAVRLKVEESSTIANIIRDTFNEQEYEKNCHIINFTDLIKLYNSINKIDNNFSDDKTLDNVNNEEVKNNISTLDEYAMDRKERCRKINEKLQLNKKEQFFNNDNYKKLIIEMVVNSSFEYYGKYPIDKRQSKELEILKRFAIRNRKINDIDCFSSLLLNLKISMHKQHPVSNIYSGIKTLGEDYDLGGLKERERVKQLIKTNNNTSIKKG